MVVGSAELKNFQPGLKDHELARQKELNRKMGEQLVRVVDGVCEIY